MINIFWKISNHMMDDIFHLENYHIILLMINIPSQISNFITDDIFLVRYDFSPACNNSFCLTCNSWAVIRFWKYTYPVPFCVTRISGPYRPLILALAEGWPTALTRGFATLNLEGASPPSLHEGLYSSLQSSLYILRMCWLLVLTPQKSAFDWASSFWFEFFCKCKFVSNSLVEKLLRRGDGQLL